MKKLFVLFACVALFAACNSGATEAPSTDTTEVSDETLTDMVTETASTETVDASTATVEATATK